MIENYRNKPTYSLLIALIFLISCNGQVKSVTQKDKENTLSGQAKIPTPKGTNKDARIVAGIEDTNGNLWFSSIGEGVFKYDGISFFKIKMAIFGLGLKKD